MKIPKSFSRLLAMVLTLTLVVSILPMQASAAAGDLSSLNTGITGDIDTTDTIALPIEIFDYKADGMLFEYSDANTAKTAADFGAAWSLQYANTSAAYSGWSFVSWANKSNSYANWVRGTWRSNTTANYHEGFSGGRSAELFDGFSVNFAQMRYLVLVYRTNVTNPKFRFGIKFADAAGAGNATNHTNDFTGTKSETNWVYTVFDLYNGGLSAASASRGNASGVYTGLPMSSSGQWIDIAHVAAFSSESRAKMFGEYALTDGSDRGNNLAYGMLFGSTSETEVSPSVTHQEPISSVVNSVVKPNTKVTEYTELDQIGVDMSKVGYHLHGKFLGWASFGLLQSRLVNDRPVYKPEVVSYIADLLSDTLTIKERTTDGWKNYRFVAGEARELYGNMDLASALRLRITEGLGTYEASHAKNSNSATPLVGTWTDVEKNIKTYHDAAYFLLNSIFVPNSYNIPQNDFQTLVLAGATDSETGSHTYVFDAGFVGAGDTSKVVVPSSVEYKYDGETENPLDGFIRNTSGLGKAGFYYNSKDETTLHPFLPVNNEEETKTPYYQGDGVLNTGTNKDTLRGRNFNYVLQSHGDFVYDPDENLFFNFQGDDDVYLFINNELVLDIGSAHSIDGIRIQLNDYVNHAWEKVNAGSTDPRDIALALEEGRTYSFDFFYMERHSYGANMRINTNIRLIDPTMATEKKAWQNGNQIEFGGIVDKSQVIEYGFALTNTGAERLFYFNFDDNDIGVELSYQNGLEVTGSQVCDLNGGTLDPTDITIKLTGFKDWNDPINGVPHDPTEPIYVTFKDNDEIIYFLTNLKAEGTDMDNAGLWPFSTIEIRGIGYKLSEAQAKEGFFDNKVLVYASNETKSKKLDGDGRMRVCIPSDPMYYQWAGKTLVVSREKLIDDVLAAAKQQGNALEGKVPDLTANNVTQWYISDRRGNIQTSTDATISGTNLNIQYTKTGSNVFYVTVVYNKGNNRVVVPVLANVTDVMDSVFVLDYGLMAELTKDNALTKNDTLTVPGRVTKSTILGVGTGGSYGNNKISFTKDDDGKIRVDDSAKGEFTLTDQTLRYMPDKFMDRLETIQVAVNVFESGITPAALAADLNINKEIQMFKNISVLPATVVYYEDNFPGITYMTVSDSGATQVVNTFTEINSTSSPYYDPYYTGSQGLDQDQEYGQDKLYQDPENDDDSGRSCHTIVIRDANRFATFQFTGTGFELIARTTSACKSATIVLTVTDEKGEVVKRIPVITEYDNVGSGANESIYQVPVIRVDGLEKATYTVAINGVPAYDYNKPVGDWYEMIDSYFYLDGIRIFQPMGSSNENYNDNENGATFAEIRDLIIEGLAAATKYDGANMSVSTGTTTWTENHLGVDSDLDDGEKTEYTGAADSVEDYLLFGPNNEVYMNGDLEDSALVFYVKKNEGEVHNMQIAVRAMDQLQFFGVGTSAEGDISALIEYGVKVDGVFAWTPLVTVASSTEQYFTIDLTHCPVDTNGRIQVAVRVAKGMASFTTLKYNGVTLAAVGSDPTDLRYQNGVLVKPGENNEYVPVTEENYPAFGMLSSQVRGEQVSEIKESEPEVTEPEVPLTEAEKKQNLLNNLKESADYAKELAGQNNET